MAGDLNGGRGAGAKRPMRPRELQDPLNHYLYHPLAWQLARKLAPTPLTPNMVSIFGGLCVVAAGIAYAQPWGVAGVGLGLILHMSWHIVDGADGDLARITGRSSPLGELVDGMCDYISHIVLYFILGWLLSRQIGGIAWPIMVAAGVSHAVQSNHVEVQRRFYQWWVYSVPWLNNSQQQDSGGQLGSLFGWIVKYYLMLATGMTPHAQKIDAAVSTAQQQPDELDRIRSMVRQESPSLLLICKFLGPNPRAIVLGLSMLAGSPLWYFIYQAVVLNLMMVWSVIAHNAAAKRIAARIGG